MADKPTQTSPNKPVQNRQDRLKAALKANMAKRKAQARARAENTGDESGKSED
ncbi:hypothetical protein [Pontibaca salina]|uniref:Uncharacterized protein n=1 Tax=Pontibaca salina TaxID=2795731 RepID=A0A934HPY5_9RHOB|nr:hypothetical protein [Pontibaca salina]MBI6628430.1 hypothetical protein [Pontibaca salina]